MYFSNATIKTSLRDFDVFILSLVLREIFELRSLYLTCRPGGAAGWRHLLPPHSAGVQCQLVSVYIRRGCHNLGFKRPLVLWTKSDVNDLNHIRSSRRFKMPSLEFPEPMTFHPTLEQWKDLPRYNLYREVLSCILTFVVKP